MNRTWGEFGFEAGVLLGVLLIGMLLYQLSVGKQKRWLTNSRSLPGVLGKFIVVIAGLLIWGGVMVIILLGLYVVLEAAR